MKKSAFILTILLVTIGKLSIAQSITVTGNINDGKGNPLHYVFVADNELKTAVFTDSLGNFTIAIPPGLKLKFRHEGFADTLITITNSNTSLQFAMRSLGSGSTGTLSAQKTVSEQGQSAHTEGSDMGSLSNGSSIGGAGLAHKKGNVHGSRYLFEDFVHGFLVNSSNGIVYDPAYLFDYDKIGGGLLVAKDPTSVVEADRDQTNSFTLYSNTDQRFVFEKVPTIDAKHYVQVLTSGKKYAIYKTISTTFKKSDFINAGITTHGNDYDEFVDDYVYYFFDVQTNQMQKINLRKKALKAAFAKEADKVNKYFSDNTGEIDDTYVEDLGDYMNK
jgi:hypothetical protein